MSLDQMRDAINASVHLIHDFESGLASNRNLHFTRMHGEILERKLASLNLQDNSSVTLRHYDVILHSMLF